MLELLGAPGYETISDPDLHVVDQVEALVGAGLSPVIAEIGVGIGATTLRLAQALKGRGQLHIFDFAHSVDMLKNDLEKLGFNNVFAYGNTKKHWDSYHWSLGRLIQQHPNGDLFDLIYLDGSHTYLHDALAFFQCDRLLKVGGTIVFDDYYWSYGNSRALAETRHECMTEEQINSRQIQLFVDTLVKTHPDYEETQPNKAYRKVRSTTRGA